MISSEATSIEEKLTEKIYIFVLSVNFKQRPRRKNKVYIFLNLNRNSDNYCVRIILLDREQETLKILVKSF